MKTAFCNYKILKLTHHGTPMLWTPFVTIDSFSIYVVEQHPFTLREKLRTFSLKIVFSHIAIVICENVIIIYSAVLWWYLIQYTKHKPTLYRYAIIIYLAVRRDEQPLKINTLSVKRFAISLIVWEIFWMALMQILITKHTQWVTTNSACSASWRCQQIFCSSDIQTCTDRAVPCPAVSTFTEITPDIILTYFVIITVICALHTFVYV